MASAGQGVPSVFKAGNDFMDQTRGVEIYAALQRMGLIKHGARPHLVPLAGGVSSDIFRVELASGPICIKQALSKLKVRMDWSAPVERSRWEVKWLRAAGRFVPEAVPEILGEDADTGLFAMAYLPPDNYPVWKAQLRDGVVDSGVATEVARRIARIHAATAGNDGIEAEFATDHIFHPIRLEPYLLATAAAHPDCAARLALLAKQTGETKRALVHGDVSPKNILVGPRGPVFLDAECAWYGDPAFDLAFCLNHMLLKCLWRPQWRERYLECFDVLANTYLSLVNWEPRAEIEARTAHLLPGLFLGRVDGRSPVEYVTDDQDKNRVRRVARRLLLNSVDRLHQIRTPWREELETE